MEAKKKGSDNGRTQYGETYSLTTTWLVIFGWTERLPEIIRFCFAWLLHRTLHRLPASEVDCRLLALIFLNCCK